MKMWQWLVATSVSGITAGIAIVSFLQGLVYTNVQGKAIEDRVQTIESKIKENELLQREDITHIRDRMDEIYKLIVRNRSNE
jgi:hypothetical protein